MSSWSFFLLTDSNSHWGVTCSQMQTGAPFSKHLTLAGIWTRYSPWFDKFWPSSSPLSSLSLFFNVKVEQSSFLLQGDSVHSNGNWIWTQCLRERGCMFGRKLLGVGIRERKNISSVLSGEQRVRNKGCWWLRLRSCISCHRWERATDTGET